jgi:hypothetical protein
MTYDNPHPERLGTADKAIGRMRIWAKNADDAGTIARQIVDKKRLEYLYTISIDAVTGIILEQILNDPLNGYDYVDAPETATETAPVIELVAK